MTPAPVPHGQSGGKSVVLSHGKPKPRSVSMVTSITAEQVAMIVEAAGCERDKLMIEVGWVTGGRISEVLGLTSEGIEKDALYIRNLKTPSQPFKRVFLPSDRDLPGRLLLWQKAEHIADEAPLFRINRQSAWRLIREASLAAGVMVRSLRRSSYGPPGTLVPIWPHVLRHSRAMQILRYTHDMELVKEQLGHSSLRMMAFYLKYSDEERSAKMAAIPA